VLENNKKKEPLIRTQSCIKNRKMSEFIAKMIKTALKKAKIREIDSKAIISHSEEFNPVYD